MKNIDPQNIKIDQLAQHRRSQGVSAQDLADQIKVSRNTIRNIEKGHFEKVGAAPFVRGHVINYCKALDLDASVVLGQIPGQVLQHQNVQRPDAFLPRSVSRVRRQTNHLGRYVFGTALLGVLGLSGYFVWDKWDFFQSKSIELVGQATSENTVTYSSIIPPVQSHNTRPATEDQKETEDPAKATAEDAQAASPTETPDPNSQDVQTDDASESSGEIQNAPNQTVLAAKPDSAQSTNDGQFVIEFELQEQAWVSIKTEAGDKVIHDMIGPGSRRYVSDEPMNMRIGNADKLTLSINGEAVDLAPHTSKNLAKLSWPSQ